MNNFSTEINNYISAIRKSRLSIYDPIEFDSELWIPNPHLEFLLNKALRGISLRGLPLRTRSKEIKSLICKVLGYPVPPSFKKTQPRFPGQNFDTYIQKSNNLQVWNEEISPTRRYVIIRVSENDVIEKVKVVTGEILALFDTTGTLTQKYQARLSVRDEASELITENDTENLQGCIVPNRTRPLSSYIPTAPPTPEVLLSIKEIYELLRPLVGQSFPDTGYDQERNRGAELHRLVCMRLGYSDFREDGRFPDIRNQLLEIKLQTSPTIDLGLVRPDSQEVLDIPKIRGRPIRHCDVRYALFYAATDGSKVTLTNFYLTTGEAFFSRFNQFQGKVLNKKLQIPLPRTLFD